MMVFPTGNPHAELQESGLAVYLRCVPADPNPDAQEEWEACCAFTLTVCNQTKVRRDTTWRNHGICHHFKQNARTWGTHSLLPLSVVNDPSQGFIVDGRIKLKARVWMIFTTVKVLQTPSLARHSGFGVIDSSDAAWRSYEVMVCTPLAKFKAQVAQDLGLPSPDHLRLWALSQPRPDIVLAPRGLLLPPTPTEEVPAPEATLLTVLVQFMDDFFTARVWAECAGDGCLHLHSPTAAPPSVLPGEAEPPPPAAAAPALGSALVVHDPGAPLPVLPLCPDPVDGAPEPDSDLHALVFLKWLDPESGGVRYASHAVVPRSLPLRHLFAAVAGPLGLPPQSLAVHVETVPADWQAGSATVQRFLPWAQVAGGAAELTIASAGLKNGEILTFHLADK
jgi:hypothetical protein